MKSTISPRGITQQQYNGVERATKPQAEALIIFGTDTGLGDVVGYAHRGGGESICNNKIDMWVFDHPQAMMLMYKCFDY